MRTAEDVGPYNFNLFVGCKYPVNPQFEEYLNSYFLLVAFTLYQLTLRNYFVILK